MTLTRAINRGASSARSGPAGRRLGQVGGGASAPALPTGAVGVWYMDEYQSSPRPYIPNAAATASTPNNLLSTGRGLFASGKQFLFQTSCTMTDDAAAGQDGKSYASTLVASASNWNTTRTVPSVPAGNYTLAATVKRGAGVDETFKLYVGGKVTPAETATSSWQRYSYSFSHAGGSLQIGLLHNSTTPSLVLDDLALYAGSSDLGRDAEIGNLLMGASAYDRPGSYSGGILDMSTGNATGVVQFPDNLDLSAGITLVSMFRKVGADTNYVPVFAKPAAQNIVGMWIERNGLPGFSYSNDATFEDSYSEYWDFTSKGWHTLAHRYDPVGLERSLWLDGGKLHRQTGTISAQTVRNLVMTALSGTSSYGNGYQFAGGIALYNRALTDAEILQAKAHLKARAGASATQGPIRALEAEGDSITRGDTQYVSQFKTNQSPTNIGQIFAVGGSTLADVSARLSHTRAKKPAITEAGSKYIFSIMVTNSVDTLATAQEYLDALQVICDTMRADGWLVAVGTVTPRASAPFNAKRNTVNAGIRTWVGTHCDVVFDFAADATIGTDAAGSNATYYPDGVHPTATVQSTYMEPIYRAAINSL